MERLYFFEVLEKDIRNLIGIEQESFQKTWGYVSFLEEINCGWARVIGMGQTVENTSKIYGFICFRVVIDEMEITRIAVSKLKRRSGIASRLIGRSIDEASAMGAKSCYLEVDASNQAAILLYEKHGFERIGIRQCYYSENGTDGIVMRKRIEVNS